MSFGSFLAFYLADLGWSKQNVGLALTVGGSAGVAAQIPGGALADAVHWKRGLAASGFGPDWSLGTHSRAPAALLARIRG